MAELLQESSNLRQVIRRSTGEALVDLAQSSPVPEKVIREILDSHKSQDLLRGLYRKGSDLARSDRPCTKSDALAYLNLICLITKEFNESLLETDSQGRLNKSVLLTELLQISAAIRTKVPDDDIVNLATTIHDNIFFSFINSGKIEYLEKGDDDYDPEYGVNTASLDPCGRFYPSGRLLDEFTCLSQATFEKVVVDPEKFPAVELDAFDSSRFADILRKALGVWPTDKIAVGLERYSLRQRQNSPKLASEIKDLIEMHLGPATLVRVQNCFNLSESEKVRLLTSTANEPGSSSNLSPGTVWRLDLPRATLEKMRSLHPAIGYVFDLVGDYCPPKATIEYSRYQELGLHVNTKDRVEALLALHNQDPVDDLSLGGRHDLDFGGRLDLDSDKFSESNLLPFTNGDRVKLAKAMLEMGQYQTVTANFQEFGLTAADISPVLVEELTELASSENRDRAISEVSHMYSAILTLPPDAQREIGEATGLLQAKNDLGAFASYLYFNYREQKLNGSNLNFREMIDRILGSDKCAANRIEKVLDFSRSRTWGDDHFDNNCREATLALVAHGAISAKLMEDLCSREFSITDWRKILGQLCKYGHIDNIYKISQSNVPLSALEPFENDLHLLKFKEEVGIDSLEIYREYLALTKSGDPIALEAYVAGILELRDRVLSAGPQNVMELTALPFYRDIVTSCFPNHAGKWTSFELNESCADRTADIAHYQMKARYDFIVESGGKLVIRPGLSSDPSAVNTGEAPIKQVQSHAASLAYAKGTLDALVDERLDAIGSAVSSVVESREGKILLLLMESLLSGKRSDQVRELLVAYHFNNTADIQSYLAGTIDRTNQSKNAEYAYLLELHQFYSDQLKETLRALVETALKDPRVRAEIERGIAQMQSDTQNSRREETRAIAEASKLGATSGFMLNLARIANGQSGDNQKRALSGAIMAESAKVAKVLSRITGSLWDPADISLDPEWIRETINRSLTTQPKAKFTQLDSDQTENFLASAVTGLFSLQIDKIEAELQKYVPELSEKEPDRRMTAYFAKNHTSAHARGVAGVCVAGNNPRKLGLDSFCIWNLKGYFDLVLADPSIKRCEGAVLLHAEEEDGETTLHASFNPTSTVLYKLDERALFRELMGILKEFGANNNFDRIVTSTNKQIRTNRTGGEFENEIDAQITKVGKQFMFKRPRTFSTRPEYSLTTCDVLWENPAKVSRN